MTNAAKARCGRLVRREVGGWLVALRGGGTIRLDASHLPSDAHDGEKVEVVMSQDSEFAVRRLWL